MQNGQKNKNMNKLQLITCVLLVFSIFVIIIGGNNLKNQIKELQTTVTRQANAIQQLEKERNNLEVTIPSNSLPDGDQ